MRFVCGSPSVFAPCFTDDRDAIVQVAHHPQGTLLAVLTSSTLQIWGGLQHTVHLTTVSLTQCSVGPRGADAAMAVTWSPNGSRIAIGTIRRRVIIVEQDVLVKTNEDAVSIDPIRSTLLLSDAAVRLAVSSETQLDHGLITSVVAATESTLLVTTVGGYVVMLEWATGVCITALRSSAFLEKLAPKEQSPVSGSLIGLSYSHCQKLLTAVFSDGSLVTADVGDGKGLIDNVVSSTFTTGTSAEMVALSPNEPLLAVVSNASTIRLFIVDRSSGAVVVRPMESIAPWRDQVSSLGRITSISWSTEGGMFAVGFASAGAALFHSSGVCLWASFPRLEGGLLPPGARQLVPKGCKAVAIGSFSSTLVGVDSTGQYFFTCGLSKSINSEPSLSATSVASLASAGGISLLRYGEGPTHVWESHPLPADYLRTHYPIRYSSASPCGEMYLVAGSVGAAMFSSRTGAWVSLPKDDERLLEVVADPCWLSSAVVAVPVIMRKDKSFAVVLFQRGYLGLSAALHTIWLTRRPTHLSTSPCATQSASTLAVADISNTIGTWTVTTRTDRQLAPRIVQVRCDEGPSTHIPTLHPIATMCVYKMPTGQYTALLLGRDGVLRSAPIGGNRKVDSSKGVICETVSPVWTEKKRVGGDQEFAYRMVLQWEGSQPQMMLATTRGVRLLPLSGGSLEKPSPLISIFDGEVLMIGLLPRDGLVLLGGEGINRPHLVAGMHIPHDVSVRAEVYHHLSLLQLLVPATGGGNAQDVPAGALHQHVHRMREAGTFAAVMDYLLYYAIVDGDELPVDSTTQVLSAAISCLKRYPEYYEVITGCVRKIDVSMWKMVFDIIGPPLGFFEECVRSGRVVEGAHIVRVILMSHPESTASALGSTLECGARLFAQALDAHDVGLAYELMRFLTLLCTEVDLPPLDVANPPSIQRILHAHLRDRGISPTGRTPPKLPTDHVLTTLLIRPLFFGRGDGESHDKTASEATFGMLQRPELSSLPNRIQDYALSLYTSGKAVALCSLFELFSLDLCYFIEHVGAFLDAANRTPSLSTLFALMHVDLGLPRGRTAVSRPVTLLADVIVAPQGAGKSVYTTTQAYLYAIPSLVQALASLATLFHSFGCLEYVVAIHVLLGQVGAAEQVAKRERAPRATQPPLSEALLDLFSENANLGYTSPQSIL